MPPRVRPSRVRRPAPVSESLQGIGARLRAARLEAGLSQAQLGAPHFTRAYVSAIELGKVRPAMKSLEFLAAKVGKPVTFFVVDEAAEQARQRREADIARASQLCAEGRGQEALAILEPLLEAPATTHERAVILRGLGRALLATNEAGRAAGKLADAVRLFEATGDVENAVRATAQVGMAMHVLMSYAEAAQRFEEVLEALARGVLHDPLLKVQTLHNLGATFFQRLDYPTALQYFERAEAEGADIGDTRWMASLLAAMGMTRYELGDYEAAAACMGRSEALFEAVNNRSRAAEIHFHRGRTLRALGHKVRGREMLHEAHQAATTLGNRHLQARIAMNLAEAEVEDGDIAAGTARLEGCIRDSDEIGDLYLRLATRTLAGRAWAPLEPERAESVLREAVGLFEGAEEPPDLAEAHSALSQLLAKRGLAEEAVHYAARAVRFVRPRLGKEGTN